MVQLKKGYTAQELALTSNTQLTRRPFDASKSISAMYGRQMAHATLPDAYNGIAALFFASQNERVRERLVASASVDKLSELAIGLNDSVLSHLTFLGGRLLNTKADGSELKVRGALIGNPVGYASSIYAADPRLRSGYSSILYGALVALASGTSDVVTKTDDFVYAIEHGLPAFTLAGVRQRLDRYYDSLEAHSYSSVVSLLELGGSVIGLYEQAPEAVQSCYAYYTSGGGDFASFVKSVAARFPKRKELRLEGITTLDQLLSSLDDKGSEMHTVAAAFLNACVASLIVDEYKDLEKATGEYKTGADLDERDLTSAIVRHACDVFCAQMLYGVTEDGRACAFVTAFANSSLLLNHIDGSSLEQFLSQVFEISNADTAAPSSRVPLHLDDRAKEEQVQQSILRSWLLNRGLAEYVKEQSKNVLVDTYRHLFALIQVRKAAQTFIAELPTRLRASASKLDELLKEVRERAYALRDAVTDTEVEAAVGDLRRMMQMRFSFVGHLVTLADRAGIATSATTARILDDIFFASRDSTDLQRLNKLIKEAFGNVVTLTFEDSSEMLPLAYERVAGPAMHYVTGTLLAESAISRYANLRDKAHIASTLIRDLLQEGYEHLLGTSCAGGVLTLTPIDMYVGLGMRCCGSDTVKANTRSGGYALAVKDISWSRNVKDKASAVTAAYFAAASVYIANGVRSRALSAGLRFAYAASVLRALASLPSKLLEVISEYNPEATIGERLNEAINKCDQAISALAAPACDKEWLMQLARCNSLDSELTDLLLGLSDGGREVNLRTLCDDVVAGDLLSALDNLMNGIISRNRLLADNDPASAETVNDINVETLGAAAGVPFVDATVVESRVEAPTVRINDELARSFKDFVLSVRNDDFSADVRLLAQFDSVDSSRLSVVGDLSRILAPSVRVIGACDSSRSLANDLVKEANRLMLAQRQCFVYNNGMSAHRYDCVVRKYGPELPQILRFPVTPDSANIRGLRTEWVWIEPRRFGSQLDAILSVVGLSARTRVRPETGLAIRDIVEACAAANKAQRQDNASFVYVYPLQGTTKSIDRTAAMCPLSDFIQVSDDYASDFGADLHALASYEVGVVAAADVERLFGRVIMSPTHQSSSQVLVDLYTGFAMPVSIAPLCQIELDRVDDVRLLGDFGAAVYLRRNVLAVAGLLAQSDAAESDDSAEASLLSL